MKFSCAAVRYRYNRYRYRANQTERRCDDDAAQLMFVDAGTPAKSCLSLGFELVPRLGLEFVSAAEKLSRSSLGPLPTEIRYCAGAGTRRDLLAETLCCGRLPSLASELFETKTDKALIRSAARRALRLDNIAETETEPKPTNQPTSQPAANGYTNTEAPNTQHRAQQIQIQRYFPRGCACVGLCAREMLFSDIASTANGILIIA